ncbi:hypothetical protein VTN77DRAFT_9012 [Rasamsonia byssochlamydoides]|uniref:uncharacterized protein n=1 Tax=Rasamsonia byssochlamydoides TaxID=89139 RepID=UPI0037444E09
MILKAEGRLDWTGPLMNLDLFLLSWNTGLQTSWLAFSCCNIWTTIYESVTYGQGGRKLEASYGKFSLIWQAGETYIKWQEFTSFCVSILSTPSSTNLSSLHSILAIPISNLTLTKPTMKSISTILCLALPLIAAGAPSLTKRDEICEIIGNDGPVN